MYQHKVGGGRGVHDNGGNRGGGCERREPFAVTLSIAPPPTIEIVTLDIVVWQWGGGCSNDSDGDVIALAATITGGGLRDERGGRRRRRQWWRRRQCCLAKADGAAFATTMTVRRRWWRWTTATRPSRRLGVAAGERVGLRSP